jgi:arylsulfatase A-like enzyme
MGVLLVMGCSSPGTDGPRGAGRTHVLLISIDTLNADAVEQASRESGGGGLASLRDRFTRCERAVSTASWTLPANASMLTGYFPAEHGANRPGAVIRADLPRLAERLSAEGYETVAFTDGGFVGCHHGFPRGFDLFNNQAKQGYDAIRSQLPRQGDVEPEPGNAPFDRAMRFLELRRSGRPLFLFLHSYGVHDYFKGHFWVEPDPSRREQARSLAPCLVDVNRCAEREWEIFREWYRKAVWRMGVLLQELLERAADELDDAPIAVLLVSDHGEGFDPASGGVHYGGWLLPEYLRIPLWAQVPSEVGTVRCDGIVSLIDNVPTILGMANVAYTGLPGRSLVDTGAFEEGARTLYGEDHF